MSQSRRGQPTRGPVRAFIYAFLYYSCRVDGSNPRFSREIDRGIAYLKQHRPDLKSAAADGHDFYAHYYAAQAMWIRGGDDWDDWYPAIRDELIARQSPEGAWHDSICDECGTSMALIVLQMPNQLLPIFQR